MEVPINASDCITSVMQALIYMHLLAITCLHNKPAVITNRLLNVFVYMYNFDPSLLTMGISNSRRIDNYATAMLTTQVTDYGWCNKLCVM